MIRIKLVMLLLLNTLISYSHTHDTEESMLTYSLSSTNDPTFLLPNAEPDNTLNNTNESKIRRKTHFFMTVGRMLTHVGIKHTKAVILKVTHRYHPN